MYTSLYSHISYSYICIIIDNYITHFLKIQFHIGNVNPGFIDSWTVDHLRGVAF